ncbi:MAG: hypothetical protein ACKVZ0_19825 [Gemmatimonadales bacterium]
MRPGVTLLLAGLLTGPALAQDPPATLAVKQFGWPTDRFLSNRTELLVWLSRPPTAAERIAMVVGGHDLSALVDRTGDLIHYRPHPFHLPIGETEVAVFVVDSAGAWTEIGRQPLKVRGAIGLDRARATPTADLNSTGMLDRNAVTPAPDRTTYQDLTANLGVDVTAAGRGYAISGRANLQGVSEETQRLRWNAIGREAPAVDLSDYRIGTTVGVAELALGAVTLGANRFLLNGFGSRGLQAGFKLSPAVHLGLGLVSGTNVVGWTNLLGMTDSDHRIGLAALGIQLIPSRPGAIQLDVTAVDGSVRPVAGFNQGAATDAETSRGVGFSLAASDLRQRLRFSAGISRSRFSNPADPLLFQDSAIVAVQATTRQARFGELSVRLLDNARITKTIAASVGVTGRHERVDPLYRSVGTFVAADQEQNAIELSSTLGALSLQGAATSARDNLGAIASILTTRTRSSSWSASVPVASLFGVKASWHWPAASFGWQRTRQFGDGVPVDGGFQPTHVPDQVSINRTGALNWTLGAAALGYRWNRSTQDNRQVGRELADFRTDVHGLTVTGPAGRTLTIGLDLGVERNRSDELGLTQRVERIGANLQWQLTTRAALAGAVSQMWSEDPRSDQRLRNTEMYGELSQGFNLYRRPEGGTQGRVFVRYGRTRSALAPLSTNDPFQPTLTWMLTAGSSLRAF